MKHTAHGTVTGDATEETPAGYDLTLWCSCGETFAIRVTPEMALDDFIAQVARNCLRSGSRSHGARSSSASGIRRDTVDRQIARQACHFETACAASGSSRAASTVAS